ncbi:MAG: double-strand break repair helicase AddA [Erythrobacter sp.]
MSGTVYPLKGNQLGAADPSENVWLSASAGTGKTQVLSARVLRLLLRPGVEPSQILCLTFTKAGAAEMANRINSVLARWVRLDDDKLATELKDLGETIGSGTRERARTLFASVLDCPGGGLRIDTIHAFSQWLLANFPEEAELTPGTRPMEDRERELLAREVLSDMLSEAQEYGDATILDAASRFAREKDPEALRTWLMRCAGAADLWEGPTSWQPPMRSRVNRLLGIPADADMDWADEVLDPETFPDDHVIAMIGPLEAWKTKTAASCVEHLRRWLNLDLAGRKECVGTFKTTVLKGDGTPSLKLKKPREDHPQFAEAQDMVGEAVRMHEERHALLALAEFLTPALELGRAFALRWEKAKLREGLLDFDDLIRKAARLLEDSDASAWIRYKLDRSFDHVLIDEAQDTNSAQWDIVFALIDDYFSGAGAREDRLRTIFTVGDYKQAIFGFQGTSPDNFERAKQKVFERIEAARQYARELRDGRDLPGWAPLDLGESFRTSRPVLDFVNRAIKAIGHEQFGLATPPPQHIGGERAGLVTLWNPVVRDSDTDESDRDERDREDDDKRDWLPAHETILADRIAEQVRRWVSDEDPFVLEKGTSRHAREGDIMILVRKRRELATQIVAKLHAKGVSVAGVDRLRLGAPLAVKDLMAALRFAAQPLDDLSLANLLSSPIMGWSQDDLLEHVPRGPRARLWHHLRELEHPLVARTVESLRELLARADYQTPQALLAWMLTGPWQARARLAARLGHEASDPIDELVNAAFAYESGQTPSLTDFIEWFDAGQSELKRDPDEATGQVRVMTVHGSKGLQAPIVILADAAGDPGGGGALDLPDDPIGHEGKGARRVPLPPLSKDQRLGHVAAANEKAEASAMQEHWRLLYVAMTRAEEALFIGGSLGKRQAKSGVPEDSWHARLEPLFDTPELADPVWGARRESGVRADPIVPSDAEEIPMPVVKLPDWARQPVGPEPAPPRPLAPSGAGEDRSADPPLSAEHAAIAARRGTLLHRLLERLPELLPTERADAARAWLERQADDLDNEVREEMVAQAIGVLDHSDFAAIFGPEALAEVPLAATVRDIVVAGTADRLLVTDDTVTVVDFKTTRRPPTSLDSVPGDTRRQMAAYVAALAAIYPGREIRAALLYTHAPILIELPGETLDAHKDRLGDVQESYAPRRVE